MLLHKMFQRKWILATMLVLAGTALCIRLGIWQLDRLTQRRAFNHQVESMRAAPTLNLNQELPKDIAKMEWRPVTVQGKYDFEDQVALRNQYNNSQYGYHLITPLLLDSSPDSGQSPVTVLVDRGWIPVDVATTSTPVDWRKYDQPGEVTVTGQIRLGETKPAFGGVADQIPPKGQKLALWNNVDVAHIADQLPYPVLPVYIQPDVDKNDANPPIPYQPELDLSEGPHLGYAFQWFTFATILFVGYPFYLRKQEGK